MRFSAVAARYANALADVITASPSHTAAPEGIVAELNSFDVALRSSAELHNALVTPGVPPSRKKAVVGRIAEKLHLSRISRNFLFVLVDHRRIASFSDIIQTLEVVLDERLGYARAEVVSAGELTEAQQRALNARLERLTGKRIRMRFSVDAALLGGVVARIGSTVYDGSVRGQLAALERRLDAEA